MTSLWLINGKQLSNAIYRKSKVITIIFLLLNAINHHTLKNYFRHTDALQEIPSEFNETGGVLEIMFY